MIDAPTIIRDVCFQFAVDPDEFSGRSRATSGPIGNARAEVTRRLRSAGLSVYQVAQLLDTDGATIAFYGERA